MTQYIHQGLCESKVDCSVTGAASDLPGLFVSHARSVLVTALQRLAGLAYQVNLTLLTAIIALYLPSPAEPSLLEFGESDLFFSARWGIRTPQISSILIRIGVDFQGTRWLR